MGEEIMEIFKYLSLVVGILSMNCWGMQQQAPFSFEDMKIEHKVSVNGRSEICLIHNGNNVGFIEYDSYKIPDLDKFIANRCMDKSIRYMAERAITDEECKAPFLKGQTFVELYYIKLAGNYQQQGLGKRFMAYFLQYIKDNNIEPVILLKPAQSFAVKDKSISTYELDKRLRHFYKDFGAVPYRGIYGTLYIDLKTEKTPVVLIKKTKLPEF